MLEVDHQGQAISQQLWVAVVVRQKSRTYTYVCPLDSLFESKWI